VPIAKSEERSGFDRPASVAPEPDNPSLVFTRDGEPLSCLKRGSRQAGWLPASELMGQREIVEV
jgi:hypothetical protein